LPTSPTSPHVALQGFYYIDENHGYDEVRHCVCGCIARGVGVGRASSTCLTRGCALRATSIPHPQKAWKADSDREYIFSHTDFIKKVKEEFRPYM